MITPDFHSYVMAVERVEQRLRKVTAALESAGVPYAVIGGNAVAAWVSRVDPSAVRSTRDVDLLIRSDDEAKVNEVMASIGFNREPLRRLVMFTDPEEPSRRSGVHFIFAEQRVRPSYVEPTPSVEESVRDSQGFMVVDLPALVRMKLTSYRLKDRVHLLDMIDVSLIDRSWCDRLPDELAKRLGELLDNPDG